MKPSESHKIGYSTTAPPIIHNIELTNHCIMNCIMCPRTYKMTRQKGYMDMSVFRKIIDEYVTISPLATKNTLWLHHFGESLLSPCFDEAISYASSRKLKPSLSLNPIALSHEKAVRLLKAEPHLIYISLDGCDEESFSYLRGVKGQFDKSKENTLQFLSLKKSLQSHVRIIISAIDIPGRESVLDDAQKFWEQQLGVEAFLRKPFVDFNGEIEEISKMTSIKPTSLCSTPWIYLTITWDGTVVPCCFDFDKLYPLGDIKQESLIDIWNGDKIRNLRKEFSDGKITNALCATCSSGGLAKKDDLCKKSYKAFKRHARDLYWKHLKTQV